jgi:NADPH:quinone reductase-like Zn-dependent oxidoreductase
MPTMRAALRDRYGSPDVVRVEEIERPTPVDDQLLVRIEAASVNRADLDGIQPRPPFLRLIWGIRAPRNPRVGIDAAGVVEEVGPGATRFRPGDRVFADLFSEGQGSFAEYVVARERAFQPIPEGVRVEDAATLPHSAILAIQGLRRRDGRTPMRGDRVLVLGASGNVGPFAVQLAKHYGAEVTGVCRGSKVDFVRSLGADEVIDYETTDHTTMGERWDWILDVDSHHSLFDERRALRKGGVYITLGGNTWPLLGALALGPVVSAATGRSMGLMLWWKPFDPDDIRVLGDLVAGGVITPRIDRTLPLDEVADALRWVNDGHARGKVLVVPLDGAR